MKTTTTKDAINNAICKNHTGKMTSIMSLSTSPLCNELCKARAKDKNTICSHCYSMTMQKRYGTLAEKLKNNSALLSETVFDDGDIPFINAAFFRFEAFGDLLNETHAVNLMTIARNNPHCTFTLWTKNPFYVRDAIEHGAVKPDNMIIILSSPLVNVNTLDMKYAVIDGFVDKVFTVYDKAHAENVEINCGGRKCADCLRCYRKNTGNDIEIVNELLK